MFECGGSIVVDLLLIVTPIVGFCNSSMLCYALLCVYIVLQSSTGKRKRRLVGLLCLSSLCLMIIVRLFLTMPRVCLQFVKFPDHTHLLYSNCCCSFSQYTTTNFILMLKDFKFFLKKSLNFIDCLPYGCKFMKSQKCLLPLSHQ